MKVGIASKPTGLDDLRRRLARSTSSAEVEGTQKSERVGCGVLRIFRGEKNEKRLGKAGRGSHRVQPVSGSARRLWR